MTGRSLNVVILGLSITSSWGNGHATTYRGLVRGLVGRGHEVLFLEREVPWYADNRDLPRPPYCRAEIYLSLTDLKRRFGDEVKSADAVIVGSYVPEGTAVGRWVTSSAGGVTVFYDIDTPVTLAQVEREESTYISAELISRYHLYLSFTGGPLLDRIEREYHAPAALPLYCSVDADLYFHYETEQKWDVGYLGTYSGDRQPLLDLLLLEPARRWKAGRYVVAGPQYPTTISWPRNVQRIVHLNPSEHCAFYNSQRFTLNVTRADMVRAGYSPSVRLFEAAACATPLISDYWEGLERFLEPGKELLVSRSPEDTLRYLHEVTDAERRSLGERAQARVLARHTSAHRAAELEGYINDILDGRRPKAVESPREIEDFPG